MAFKAVAIPLAAAPGSTDNARINMNCKVVILGAQRGSYDSFEFDIEVKDIDASSKNQVDNTIASRVQTDMVEHGITFAGNDSVLVY